MVLSSTLRRRIRHVILPVLGALFLGYFGYHAIQGNRGLLAYLQLTQEIRKAEITYSLIHGERENLDKRVKLMRPDSMDPDMLQERARLVLGLGHRDDFIVMLQRTDASPRAIAQ
jgi:cell division protein FtsB